MNRLFSIAMMAVLAGAPVISRAESPTVPQTQTRDEQDRPASSADGASDDASDYAAREKKAPQLAEFSGGRDGVYLTTTALVIVLLVVLILVLI